MKRFIPWITVVPEYQRVAVFRTGRIVGYRGPGLIWRMPFLEKFELVDSRIVTEDVKPQECITRDNIPIRINAVIYFRVEKPDKAIVEVVDYRIATIEVAQSSLRGVIGQVTLDQLLSEIKETAARLKELVDDATDEWGVRVTRLEIKDINIPDEMKRAMAIEGEAERERRAMRIRAAGEKEAAAELAEAARILDSTPSGFKMRYLQTLLQVAESGNTVVFAEAEKGPAAVTAAHYQQTRLDRNRRKPAPEATKKAEEP